MLDGVRKDAENAFFAIPAKPVVKAAIEWIPAIASLGGFEDLKHGGEESRWDHDALRAEEGSAFADRVSAASEEFFLFDLACDFLPEVEVESREAVVQVEVSDGIEADGEVECPGEEERIDVYVVFDIKRGFLDWCGVPEGFLGDEAIVLWAGGIAGAEEDDGVEAGVAELRNRSCSRGFANAAACHDGQDVRGHR